MIVLFCGCDCSMKDVVLEALCGKQVNGAVKLFKVQSVEETLEKLGDSVCGIQAIVVTDGVYREKEFDTKVDVVQLAGEILSLPGSWPICYITRKYTVSKGVNRFAELDMIKLLTFPFDPDDLIQALVSGSA